jgi:hypothetical protein
MKPKKIKSFIKETAKELNLEEEFVEDLFYEYWRSVRDSLQSLESPELRIDGLGRFRVRKVNLIKYKQKYEEILENMSIDFDSHHSRKELEKRIISIKHVSDIIEQDEQAKNQKRKDRDELKKNMGQ